MGTVEQTGCPSPRVPRDQPRQTARQGSITEHWQTGRGAGLARSLGPESGTVTCLTGYPRWQLLWQRKATEVSCFGKWHCHSEHQPPISFPATSSHSSGIFESQDEWGHGRKVQVADSGLTWKAGHPGHPFDVVQALVLKRERVKSSHMALPAPHPMTASGP